MKYVVAIVTAAAFAANMLQAQEPPPPPGAPPQFAGDADDDGRTPPRLSFTHGQVSFWRPGADDWTQAQINLPLAPGDALYAGNDASLELEIGPRAFIRAGEGTQIGLENQEPDFLQLRVTSGHLAVDVREIGSGHTIEIDTPNAVFSVEKTGYYRVDVADDTSTFIARRSGSAFITPANGEVQALSQNEQIVITGSDNPTFASYAAADLDAWDRWNYERTDTRSEIKSARYVPSGVYGTRDLDDHGTWAETPDYGPVWTPRNVAADWAPYSDGRWVWDVSYGWTWVDNSPWGWAPAHYGRWVHVQNRWGWAPGPIIAAPVYAPAVVAFFGSPRVRVGVSIGVPVPTVGWVALGWGEPVVPWWGRRGYIGVPSWRGWGGPRVVNRTVINNTTVVNVNNINIYENARVRNAVVAERRDRFGRGDFGRGDGGRARIREADIQRLRPVRGNLDVRPVSASLSPRRERGARPPEQLLQRPVVATRQPRDTERTLRAQGIDVKSKPVAAARIVDRGRPGRDRAQSAAQGEQAVQPGRDGRPQQDVRQERPDGGRMDRMQQQRGNQRNQPEAERAARPQPPAPGVQPRSQDGDATGAANQGRQQRLEQQERERRQAAPQGEQRERRQAAPQIEPQQRQAAPQVEQQQRERRQARPQRAPAPVRERAARPQQQQQREQPPAARAQPENRQSQPAVRESQPRREQANRPQRAERQRVERQQQQRTERQPRREQAPAVRARPQTAPRQPAVRNARPQREQGDRPPRAQRQQQAPAAARSNQQRSSGAGDAPQRDQRKNAQQSAPKNDR